MAAPDGIHMSDEEVRRALNEIAGIAAPSGGDPFTRLAWSIRSRRGALLPFLNMFCRLFRQIDHPSRQEVSDHPRRRRALRP